MIHNLECLVNAAGGEMCLCTVELDEKPILTNDVVTCC